MRQTFPEYMHSIAKGARRYRGASILDAITIYRLGLEDESVANIRDGLIMDRLDIDADELAAINRRKDIARLDRANKPSLFYVYL